MTGTGGRRQPSPAGVLSMMTVSVMPRRTQRSSFRLLKKQRSVWKIVDDRIVNKAPAVGGVLLTDQHYPPSKLDAPYTANPWRYPLPAKPAARHKPSRGKKYRSDDPYDTPLNLRDYHHGNGKGQPSWLQPYKCWEVFGRTPVVGAAEYEVATWLNPDVEGYKVRGRKPLHSGKRAPDGGTLPPRDTWHVSAPWRSQGIALPAMKWDTRQTACSVCWGAIPKDRREYCSDECAHAGDLLRRRRRRAIKSGRWPEPRYAKRRWASTRDEIADLQPLHLDVRRIGNIVTQLLPDLKLETYE
jgi:hypothetical protein